MVITGPFDFFTTSRSGDIEVESSGGSSDCEAASFVACWARASGVHVLPVITAAAPMIALRIRKVRRSMPEGIAGSAGFAWNSLSFLGEGGVFIVVCFKFGVVVCEIRKRG